MRVELRCAHVQPLQPSPGRPVIGAHGVITEHRNAGKTGWRAVACNGETKKVRFAARLS